MADGKLGKAVMEKEISHCDEHNQNLSSPQSKTTKLRKRKVKEGDVPEDASALKLNKKKNKNKAVTTEGAAEVLIALQSPTYKAKVGLRQPLSSSRSETPNQPQANDIHGSTQPPALNSAHEVTNIQQDGVNSATPMPVAADPDVGTLTEMLGNGSSLKLKKQCPTPPVADVTVEHYKVKADLAATAQHILNKYGDIIADTSFKGSLLGHLLENVCLIYKTLENSEFTSLTIEELEAISIDLHDFQKMNVNIGWLITRLEDILNAKKVLQMLNQQLIEAKEQYKRFIEKSLVDGI